MVSFNRLFDFLRSSVPKAFLTGCRHCCSATRELEIQRGFVRQSAAEKGNAKNSKSDLWICLYSSVLRKLQLQVVTNSRAVLFTVLYPENTEVVHFVYLHKRYVIYCFLRQKNVLKTIFYLETPFEFDRQFIPDATANFYSVLVQEIKNNKLNLIGLFVSFQWKVGESRFVAVSNTFENIIQFKWN